MITEIKHVDGRSIATLAGDRSWDVGDHLNIDRAGTIVEHYRVVDVHHTPGAAMENYVITLTVEDVGE